MSTITKDLGVVTAYGYYKAGGGTMTEAEFTQFMVDFGTASKTAVDAASAALESERAAKNSEETATSKASEAGESASAASTKAGEAAQSASDADTAKTDAVNAKTAAETAQGKAEDAQAAAESVAESIPSDYSQLSEDVSDLKEGLSAMSTATSSDVGKALKAKTVTDGKVTEWEFGTVGSPTDSALSPTSENPVQNKVINGVFGNLSALSQYGSSVADILSYIINKIEHPIDPNDIDVCLFAGQSNMDGRGTAEDATPVTTGKAFKWDNANNTLVDFAAEPSLIPAYMQEYTTLSRVPLVEVKEAIGGTKIEQYVSTYLPIATNMLTKCLAYLEEQGKHVRRCFMLWNQGESDVDGDGSTGTTAYEGFFATLKSAVIQAGVNQIFIINIGQASNGTFDFAPIRTALQNVCNGTDVIMVSDKFYNATSQMKDRWHYNQTEYNIVGKDSAKNTIAFFNGQTIDIKHFDSSDIYGVPTEYGTLDDWTYTLVNEKVRLDAYNGNNANVRVYHQYLLDGYFYEARIASSPTSSVNACFTANTVIESVSVDNGVRMMNPNGNSDADNAQSLGLLFKNCTNLKSFSVGAEFPTPAGCEQVCKGATNFETFNFEPKGSLNLAFTGTKVASVGNLSGIKGMSDAFSNNTALTSVGDIDGTYTMAVSAFQGDSALESIGKIGSTALANINIMFSGCTSLAGVVRFESASISSATNAFNNCDLSKITIEVPANSTTYDTILAAYPSANIVTF